MKFSLTLKNIFIVSSGVAISQILTFIALPIISRLYTPNAFGVLGTVTSLTSVFASIATLQYPQAIMLPRRDAAASNLLAISIMCTAAISLFSAILLLLIHYSEQSHVIINPIILWAVPMLVLVAGFNQSLQAWCVRRKAFHLTAISPIIRSVTLITVQVLSYFSRFSSIGLVAGMLAGDSAANINLVRQVVTHDRQLVLRYISFTRLKLIASHYRDVAQNATMRALISTSSINFPILYLTSFGDLRIIGQFSLAMRAFQMPMSLILTSLQQVLLQKMASLHHNRISLGSITRRYIKILAAVSMPPAILLLFITPSLFSFLFGQQWYEAGQYARWLIPWGVSSFCNAPCQIAAQVLRLQKLLLNFEIVIFFSRSLVFLIALKLFSPVTAIAAWSVTSALMNTLQIISILSKTESILKNK